ncbi:MAG TPA: GH92 family glycosyl hydrolase [Verrucomicrobiae bacterium]|jgi:predicted alpha-1,2-mannosidase|nr:GH92 family glycosyl hydrolase [Verrucomicrobiae bacterium]
MKRLHTAFFAITAAGTVHLMAAQGLALAPLVNPFIGTDPNPFSKVGYSFDTGNVFPGAVCPRGMVAWSPDTTHQRQIAGGYWYPDGTIEDFSLTHFSGRGVPCLKDIPFMPVMGPIDASPGTNWNRFAATFSHANESAHGGYYRVKFDNGIETELTATPRTGMARFVFPSASAATLLIRADSSISISNNEVTGFHVGKIGGNRPYTTYFVAQFDRPFHGKTWAGEAISDAATAEDKASGAILTFDAATNSPVQVRVGISYVSIGNARANLTAENPRWDFSAVRQEADAAWNTVLNRIQVEGGTDEQRQVFYTALYHCFMHPNVLEDGDGEYPGMDGKIHRVEKGRHQYQNIPAWDQWRSYAALIAVLAPSESSDIMQSLVNYAQQDASVRTNGGGLPRWQQVNRNSGGMVGDGDDAIISSAYAFGARRFDTRAALVAMDKGASDPTATSDGARSRSGLADYLQLGYVPNEAAVTLEYCNNDFAVAQFAKALGDEKKHAEYSQRAQNWENLYDDSTGLIRPRKADGTWATNFSAGSGKGFVEGTAAQYVWMVNFNLRGLIDKMGGNDRAVERLDHFFTKLNAQPFSGDLAYMGNEPCEETPWVYDFAGAPSHAQAVVRRIQNELFTTKPNGFPGNDDAGALSSWYVFSTLGLFPEIPGVAGFAVGSPQFSKAIVHLENGKTIRIQGANASVENCYVQTLKLNGRSYDSPWIQWRDLEGGATLDFALGNQPSQWGNDSKQAPPSFDAAKP